MSQPPISRRQLLKLLAAAGTAALSSVPSKWNTPVVEASVLPAQPQLSGLGAISGTITTPIGTSPIRRGSSPSDGFTVSTVAPSTVVGRTGVLTVVSQSAETYLISDLPTGTYTVQLDNAGCAVDPSTPNPRTGVSVTAPATHTGVDFLLNCFM